MFTIIGLPAVLRCRLNITSRLVLRLWYFIIRGGIASINTCASIVINTCASIGINTCASIGINTLQV